jgi:hypothetical protein
MVQIFVTRHYENLLKLYCGTFDNGIDFNPLKNPLIGKEDIS